MSESDLRQRLAMVHQCDIEHRVFLGAASLTGQSPDVSGRRIMLGCGGAGLADDGQRVSTQSCPPPEMVRLCEALQDSRAAYATRAMDTQPPSPPPYVYECMRTVRSAERPRFKAPPESKACPPIASRSDAACDASSRSPRRSYSSPRSFRTLPQHTPSSPIHVYVMLPTREQPFKFVARDGCTVGDLKTAIQNQDGVPANRQRLAYDLWDDNRSISDVLGEYGKTGKAGERIVTAIVLYRTGD